MNDGILSVPAALVSIEPIEWQNTTSQHQRAPMRIQVRVLSDSMEAIEPVYSAVVEAMQPALHIRTEIKFSETSFYEYIGTFILNIVWKT
jgi:hypothetical protein